MIIYIYAKTIFKSKKHTPSDQQNWLVLKIFTEYLKSIHQEMEAEHPPPIL